MDTTIITTAAATAFGTSLGTNIINVPLSQLSDWWYLKFGHKTELEKSKKQLENDIHIEQFKQDLLNDLNKLPNEDIIEPKQYFLTSSLDAVQNVIDEEDLRNLFRRLITSSFDKQKTSILHNSFVEIIKQMSTTDALLIEKIGTKNLEHFQPIARIDLITPNGTTLSKGQRFTDILLLDTNEINISIDNLSRLGLIKVSFEEWLTDNSLYDSLTDNEYLLANIDNLDIFYDLKNIENDLNTLKTSPAPDITELEIEKITSDYQEIKDRFDNKYKFHKGIIIVTDFGRAFIECCVQER